MPNLSKHAKYLQREKSVIEDSKRNTS